MAGKKSRKVNKGKIIGCALAALSIVMICLLGGQVYRIYKRSVDLRNAQNRLAELEKECELVSQELDLLDDENYITRYARKNWIFTKEGESVIPLPDDAVTEKKE